MPNPISITPSTNHPGRRMGVVAPVAAVGVAAGIAGYAAAATSTLPTPLNGRRTRYGGSGVRASRLRGLIRVAPPRPSRWPR
ncbi:hypothetical protein [Mycolicibacterium lutetiense]|uniref:Uncharacterized protein n=1 Tax=Mycolicibacterium lutetiense TaxID=1641992 RepID=A0ABS5A3I6_9MYCO|nr:hypothetical protein [Mycolicibacterium lutetiense]MBP2456267.1 hypothetical protein [Mycolicibacterium lutetiense]